MSKGAVVKIIDFSSVDGPGNRMAIFLQGCNMNCWYCHNPETIPNPLNPGDGSALETAHSGYTWMTVETIVERYQKAKPFISGVTFSGGECTLQTPFLVQCFKALKDHGAHILIDTNGQIAPKDLEALLPWVDGFMPDIKMVAPDVHRALTGVDNQQILETFEKLLTLGKVTEVRTVLMGDEAHVLETVEWVAERLGRISPETPYRLIRYRAHGVRKENLSRIKPPTEALVQKCIALAHGKGARVIQTI